MACEGCQPHNNGLTPPPIVTTPPAGGTPRAKFAQALTNALVQEGAQPGGEINPAAAPGMSPQVLLLANQLRRLQLELAAVTLVLMRRTIITEGELDQARAEITQAADAEFQKGIQQLGRQMAQRPTQVGQTNPAADPRRSPG